MAMANCYRDRDVYDVDGCDVGCGRAGAGGTDTGYNTCVLSSGPI